MIGVVQFCLEGANLNGSSRAIWSGLTGYSTIVIAAWMSRFLGFSREA
jgi:hypothetical protein